MKLLHILPIKKSIKIPTLIYRGAYINNTVIAHFTNKKNQSKYPPLYIGGRILTIQLLHIFTITKDG